MSGDFICPRCGQHNGQHSASCDIIMTGARLPEWHQQTTVVDSILTYSKEVSPYDRLVATLTEYIGDDVFARRFADCIDMLRRKNSDYSKGTQGVDRVAGFRDIAIENDLTMKKVWGVFFMKHMQAIRKYIRGGKLESEPIDGRINDAINYLVLLGAIISDGETK